MKWWHVALIALGVVLALHWLKMLGRRKVPSSSAKHSAPGPVAGPAGGSGGSWGSRTRSCA
jgi:hypothetical protein